MIISFLYLLTGLLGIISASIILINYKINRVANVYLVIIFYLVASKFLFDGLNKLDVFELSNDIYFNFLPFLSALFPLTYLYFKSTAENTKQINYTELIHLVVPIIFGLSNIFWPSDYFPSFPFRSCIHISFLVFVIYYFAASFLILRKKIWKRNTSMAIVDKQNKLLCKWTTFMFVISTLISIRLLTSMFYDLSVPKSTLGLNFQWVSSLILIVLFVKILISPEILFGYNALYNKINEQKSSQFVLIELWIVTNNFKINNVQDELLRTKIRENLTHHLIGIESLALSKKWFRNPDANQTLLSAKLEIPKSHLNFIFKYHSKVSFTEFKKIIRVYDSIELMDAHYLKANTLDSLASKVGFSSYNPFFTSFKEVTGITPQAYNKQIVALRKEL